MGACDWTRLSEHVGESMLIYMLVVFFNISCQYPKIKGKQNIWRGWRSGYGSGSKWQIGCTILTGFISKHVIVHLLIESSCIFLTKFIFQKPISLKPILNIKDTFYIQYLCWNIPVEKLKHIFLLICRNILIKCQTVYIGGIWPLWLKFWIRKKKTKSVLLASETPPWICLSTIWKCTIQMPCAYF